MDKLCYSISLNAYAHELGKFYVIVGAFNPTTGKSDYVTFGGLTWAEAVDVMHRELGARTVAMGGIYNAN